MNLVELTEYLVKNVAKEPEMVSVKRFDDEDDYIIIQVMIDSNDMGAVIGSKGKIANAIRTIVQASAYINGEKKVKINMIAFFLAFKSITDHQELFSRRYVLTRIYVISKDKSCFRIKMACSIDDLFRVCIFCKIWKHSQAFFHFTTSATAVMPLDLVILGLLTQFL